MMIVIECSPDALPRLFETMSIHPGMSREVPGGAVIQLGEFSLQRRGLPAIHASLIPIFVKLGTEIAVAVFASWLYDKLKGDRKGRTMCLINREVVEVKLEAITRALMGLIEIKIKIEINIDKEKQSRLRK